MYLPPCLKNTVAFRECNTCFYARVNEEGLTLETPALLSIYGRNMTFVNSFDTTFSLYLAYARCISGDSLRMDGTRVNDSHAEVVARRSLIRFFHHHIAILLNGSSDEKSIFVQKERQGKIQLRDGVKFHLYVSTAPCGDAAVFVNESSTR